MTEPMVAAPSTRTRNVTRGPAGGVRPLDAAEQLQRELNRLGIPSEVHDGYGLALVSVRVGLVVWCDCERFWWRTGWDAERKRAVYAGHPILEPTRAASRLARHYAGVRTTQQVPAATVGAQP